VSEGQFNPKVPDETCLMKTNWQNTRDIILFFGGLAGVFNETVLNTTERPTLLILFAAMMGLPAFLRTDDRNHTPPQPPQLPERRDEHKDE
jgi:hypothetical protein